MTRDRYQNATCKFRTQTSYKCVVYSTELEAITWLICLLQKKKKKAGGGGGKKGKGKKGKGAEGPEPVVPDPFSPAARLNAYYISHGPVQFLGFRGYGWSGGGGSKKKKGGKKK